MMSIKRETIRRLQFHGHLESSNEKPPQVVSTIEFERHDPTTLSIDLLLLGEDEERRSAILYLRHSPYNHVWLHSDDASAPSVEVLGIQGISHGDTQVSINAAAIQVGITTKAQARDILWIVRVELTPSGILIEPGTHEISDEGQVTFKPMTEGAIEVLTSLGKLQVGAREDYYESEEYGNKITHTVKRASITGSINIAEGRDLFSFNEALRVEVWDICTLLSLCYRQPVDYYEINYFTHSETTLREASQLAFLRRRRDSLERKIRQDELIHYNSLVNGGLNRLLQSYTSSPHKEELSRAIRFLASSYKVTTLESSYFLAYSAFDLVASTGKSGSPYLVGSSKWKKMQKLLCNYLDSITEEQEITDVVEEMKKKLPELRRASGESRITEACRTLGVKTLDLWPKEGFEAGLGTATRMRNELFHSALLQSPDEASKHLVRVRTLVERLLLKILEWPDEKIWTWYDQNLKWING